MYFIGVDLGTSACKFLLMDEKGAILNITSRSYDVEYPRPGWSQQDPADWWRAVREGVPELLAGFDASQVAGIGCGGQMHGLVALDEKDEVIRPAILWNDGRTAEQVRYLNEEVGAARLLELTGNIAYAGFTAPKLLWMDVGLVNYVGQVRASLLQTEDISSVWSGRIAEQVVGQELISGDSRFSSFRSFYVGGSGSSAEVDFVIRHDDMVVPVEVKSGINSKLKSLHSFMDKSPYDVAVRFWPKEERSDVVKTDKGRPYRLISLPYYYAGVLDKVLTRIL